MKNRVEEMRVECRRTFRPKIGLALEFVRYFAKHDI
jgi:hypothetical protein